MGRPFTFSEALLFGKVDRKRSKTFHKLQKIEALINFAELEDFVKTLYKSNKSQGGRPPIAISIKVRMLFLQYIYNLSDEQLEDSLLGNFDFQEFVGLSLTEDVPDFTSHWRFKERLCQTGQINNFYNVIDKQVRLQGKDIKQGKISIIDATLIHSSNRPLSHEERDTLAHQPSNQKDTDATSTEKNGKKYYGYKAHINMDGETKLIQKYEVTTAKQHDIKQFEALLTGVEEEVYADKAYRSKELEKKARLIKVGYKVLRKATRNNPLSKDSIQINKEWSKTRSRVEHAFAFIKTRLHYRQARAKNLVRNKLAFMMNVVLYNVFRLSYLLSQ